MQKRSYKGTGPSSTQRCLWLSLAFFFLIFYSVPVKKYILFRIYKDYAACQDDAGYLKNSPASTIKFGFINRSKCNPVKQFAPVHRQIPDHEPATFSPAAAISALALLIPAPDPSAPDPPSGFETWAKYNHLPLFLQQRRLLV